MALRRLKPLLGAFEQIDAAIEAADAAGCGRAEPRSARARIVEMVCAAADDGGEKAEGICALLDEAMGEALATLREVPAEKIALESGDLVGAVGALMREHPSERVRGLAGDVARGWRASVTAEVESARARAAMVLGSIFATPPPPLDATAPAANSDMELKKKIQQEQLLSRKTAVATSSCRRRTVETYAPLSKRRSDPIVNSCYVKPPANMIDPAAVPEQLKKKIQQEQPLSRKTAFATSSRRVRTVETYAPLSKTRSDPIVSSSYAKPPGNMIAPAAVPEQPKKMMPPVVASSVAEEEKLENTKRKLHERYQEAEDAKRRRTIQVIKPPRPPPRMAGQRKGNAHLGVRARAPASCAAERILAKSCSLLLRV